MFVKAKNENREKKGFFPNFISGTMEPQFLFFFSKTYLEAIISRIGNHKPASVVAANALRTIKLSSFFSFAANISGNKKLLLIKVFFNYATNNSNECLDGLKLVGRDVAKDDGLGGEI